jgi:SAM-dependent methyltransferase
MADHWVDGQAYERYVGRWSRLVAAPFVQWAAIPLDGAVLDVGCGTGALSATLLANGVPEVHGIDLSAAFVEHVKAAVRAPGKKTTFSVGDGMDLHFPDANFAAAVSGLCLNFAPEPSEMVAEMRRVVRRGGVVAAYVWDYGEKMEMMRRFWDAAAQLDPIRAGPLDEGRRFPICHPERLKVLFEGAGLSAVSTTAIDQLTVFRDFDDYWTPFLGGQAPAPSYVAGLSDGERDALRDLLRSRLPPSKDGSIPMLARAIAVRGVNG